MKRNLQRPQLIPGGQQLTLDAADQFFFLRELEQKLAGSFDVKYAQLKARGFVGTGEMIDPGAESVRYEQYDKQGKAKRIANAADDLPNVKVKGKEFFSKMDNYGLAYDYTLQEIQAARMANKPLDSMRQDAVRKGNAQMLDDIIAFGDSDIGTLGVLSHTNAQDATANLTGGWNTATGDQILTDLFLMVDTIPDNTKEIESPKRIIMPSKWRRFLSRKPRTSTDSVTLLKYFMENRPGVDVQDWERCMGAGTAAKDRFVAYDPDPSNVRLLMAVEYDQLAPQQRNFAFVVNTFFRTGGVISPYPKSICYGDITG